MNPPSLFDFEALQKSTTEQVAAWLRASGVLTILLTLDPSQQQTVLRALISRLIAKGRNLSLENRRPPSLAISKPEQHLKRAMDVLDSEGSTPRGLPVDVRIQSIIDRANGVSERNIDLLERSNYPASRPVAPFKKYDGAPPAEPKPVELAPTFAKFKDIVHVNGEVERVYNFSGTLLGERLQNAWEKRCLDTPFKDCEIYVDRSIVEFSGFPDHLIESLPASAISFDPWKGAPQVSCQFHPLGPRHKVRAARRISLRSPRCEYTYVTFKIDE